MAKPKVTEREVRIARSFLKNIHGNQANGYLLLAVIAWMRGAKKAGDKFFASLTKYTAVRAGQLLAAKLRRRISQHPHDYVGLLKRIDDVPKGGTGQADQAKDFLLSIALSSWSPGHYGYKPAIPAHDVKRELPNGSFETLHVPAQAEVPPLLIKLWENLTGTTIPDAWYIDSTKTTQKATVKKAPPAQPRPLAHSVIRGEFILPYAARNFYESKPHYGQYVLEQDVRDYDL